MALTTNGHGLSPPSSSGGEPFTCELCLAELPSLPLLHTHKLVHFNTHYVCYACDLYFECPSNTVLHINARHRDCALSTKNAEATCAFCLVRCSTGRALDRHRALHTMDEVNRFTCKICAINTTSQRALILHMCTMEHQARKAWIREAFVCADCGACFSNRDAYAMHAMLRAQNDSCVPSGGNRSDAELPLQPPHHHLAHFNSTSTDNPISIKAITSPVPRKSPDPETVVIKVESVEEDEGQSAGLAPLTSKETGSSSSRPASSDQKPQPASVVLSHSHYVFGNSPFLPSISAPYERKQHTTSLLKTWLCYKCNKVFDSCDTLAMHAMDCCHISSSSSSGSNLSLKVLVDKRATNGTSLVLANQPEISSSITSSVFESSRSSLLLQNSLAQKLLRDITSPLHAQLYLPYLSQTHYALLQSIQDLNGPQTEDRTNQLSHSPSNSITDITNTKNSSDTAQANSSVETIRQILATAQQLMRCEQPAAGLDLLKDERILTPRDGHVSPATGKSVVSPLTPAHNTVLPLLVAEPLTSTSPSRVNKRILSHQDDEISCNQELKYKLSDDNLVTSSRSSAMHTARTDIRDTDHFRHVRMRPMFDASILNDSDEMIYPKRIKYNNVSFYNSEAQGNFLGNLKFARKKLNAYGDKYQNTQGGSMQEELLPDISLNTNSDELIDYSIKSGRCEENVAEVKQGDDKLLRLNSDYVQHPGDTVSTSINEHAAGVTQEEEYSNDSIVQFVVNQSDRVAICRHCKIIFIDRTLYHIHMGLHNLNNPWQCNLCGKVCQNCHDFTTHVLHLSNNG